MRVDRSAILLLAYLSLTLGVQLDCSAQTNRCITSIRAVGTKQVEITWSSDSNRWYGIEQGSDLKAFPDDLDVLVPGLVADPRTNRWVGSFSATNRLFYSIRYGMPVWGCASSVTNMGTATDDTQFHFGTTNADRAVQLGDAGADTQYVEGNAGADRIEQYGGSGDDSLTVDGGADTDFILQMGGDGDDHLLADGGSGDDQLIQVGGKGNDTLRFTGGVGNDIVWQVGCEGDDRLEVGIGDGADSLSMYGGPGADCFFYSVWIGGDRVLVDGGRGIDTLTNDLNTQTFRMVDGDGSLLWQNGTTGTIMTVRNVEHIVCVNTNVTVFEWP
jgi:hypothetical protein